MLPEWVKTLKEKYDSCISNAFILYGNIGDYACKCIKLVPYLSLFLKHKLGIQDVYVFDMAHGAKCVTKKQEKDESFYDMCGNLSDRNQESTKAYIVLYPELMFPSENRSLDENEKNNLILLDETLNSSNFMESRNVVVFITESLKDINSMLISSNTRTFTINISLPTYEERLEFIKFKVADNKCENCFANLTYEEFARFSAGLSLMNIEDIILNAQSMGVIEKSMILNMKGDIIKKQYSDIIELYDTEGFSLNKFAGQEDIKDYFKEVVIDAIKDNNLDIVPKGIMLMGPPGTGKTYFSRCLAGDAGINFVEFKMSKIMTKWVGESEKNLERAFSVFRALAPVGVFIDELDQVLSRNGNDTANSAKNIFGMFLSELSRPENRGKIIWIGATNYPNHIDEALKRPGRFDKKIPFFAPSKDERKIVFKIHLKKTGMQIGNDVDLEKLASMTEGYTQAEIENVVVKANEIASRKKKKEIDGTALYKAINYMVPTKNKKIKEMEDIAILECNDLEFLPKKYINRRNELISKNISE